MAGKDPSSAWESPTWPPRFRGCLLIAHDGFARSTANCKQDGASSMKINQLHALRVRIPQKPPIAPYQSRYRATSAKDALLIRLETDTSLVGWGETPEDWINRSFEGTPEEALRRQVLGRSPFDLEAWYAQNTLGSYL